MQLIFLSFLGLTPNTYYKVTVRAKNIKASPYVDEKSLKKLLEKLSAHTEFRTLNKGENYQQYVVLQMKNEEMSSWNLQRQCFKCLLLKLFT